MAAMRVAALLLALASAFVVLAEAKTLTGSLFGQTESYFLRHPEAVAKFKAAHSNKGVKAFGVKRASTLTDQPICVFLNELDPAGLTVCQKDVCDCPANEHCVTYQNPKLNGLGICACGSHLCDKQSGLDCAVSTNENTGRTKHTCVKHMAPPPPYHSSRLMRKALR